MMKKLFILDAHALIYRAHYALIKKPLINSQNINVSAMFGFLNYVFDLIQKENPSHLIVAFDLDTPTFRHELFSEYKAGREAQPEDIAYAIPIIKQILSAFPIQVATCEGYEADDVVGTLAKQAEKEGFEVFMMSPDKDYAQLVSENIHLYRPSHFGNEIRKHYLADVLEDWGIENVLQVIDFLALQGDSVDNIKGVKGIGEKSAKQLLAEFKTVEGIYENIDKLKGKQKELLIAGRESAFLSKKLATIDLNAPIKFEAASCQISRWDKEAVLALFKKLEFRSVTERFLKLYQQKFPEEQPVANPDTVQTDLFGNVIESAPPPAKAAVSEGRIGSKNHSNTPHRYEIADTEDKCQQLARLLAQQPKFSFDTETTGLDPHTDKLVGLSFSFEPHTGWYVPLPAEDEACKRILGIFQPAFGAETALKIGQNIKFDLLFLRKYGFDLAGKIADTMLMHYILEPEKRHSLDYLCETYLDYSPISIESLIGKKGKNQLNMRDIPLEKIAEYAAEDADLTLQLYLYFEQKLQGKQREVYEQIEAPLVQVLVEMEFVGVKIDKNFLNDYSKILQEELNRSEKSIYEKAGSPFNLNSPAQVGEILFGRLQIPYRWKKTSKTNQYSTDEEKLTELSEEYPIVAEILAHRQLAKLQSTYVEALPLLIKPSTGRVHSSFNQALTATGRLSSQNPNLQNIPVRSEKGKEIRKAFVAADENHLIVAADYSQIELRLLAAMSQDKAMVSAFQQNMDIHTATAALIYDCKPEEVSKAQRYAAKTVNFSIIYGAGATNLSKQLEIKRSEAVELIENYYKQYSGLKMFMDNTVEKARNSGYAETLCGRRRYLRDLDSQNSLQKSHAERNAVNAPIQGTAADMIKIAMINIHHRLKKAGLRSKLILQVHDELLFEAPKSELEQLREIIAQEMSQALPDLSVPIEVNIDAGDNWLEAH